MSRLTYKLDEPVETKYLHYDYMRIADYDISKGNFGRITDDKIYNKLGQLEDLEDRLGIDLITLFKALTEANGIWYKDCGKIIKVVVLSISTMRENKFCLECYYDFKRFRVDTKDFNKTWWLEKPKEKDND